MGKRFLQRLLAKFEEANESGSEEIAQDDRPSRAGLKRGRA
jgi:hypothetical protein